MAENAETTETNEVEEVVENTASTESNENTELSVEELKAQLDHWKKMSRQNERSAKQWREHEESTKSEAQKITETLESVRAEAETAKAELARLRVVTKYNVPDAGLEFLTAKDEATLEEQAKKIVALLGVTKQEETPRVRTSRVQGESVGNLPAGDNLDAKVRAQYKSRRRA